MFLIFAKNLTEFTPLTSKQICDVVLPAIFLMLKDDFFQYDIKILISYMNIIFTLLKICSFYFVITPLILSNISILTNMNALKNSQVNVFCENDGVAMLQMLHIFISAMLLIIALCFKTNIWLNLTRIFQYYRNETDKLVR